MDPDKQRRLLRWLLILGPTLSLILYTLGAWLIVETSAGQAFLRTLTGGSAAGLLDHTWIMPNFAYAAIGWLLLTLGCAAGTCLQMFRRQGKTGGALAVLVVLGTPPLAFLQVVLAIGLLFVCLATFGAF